MFNPNDKTGTAVRISNNYDKEIVLINDYTAFDLKKVPLYDVLILDHTDQEACMRTLREIRSSFIESIYLIPVFILSIVDLKNDEIQELSDGIIQTIQPDTLNTYLDSVRNRRKQLKPYTANPEINRNLIKLLRFAFTRNRVVRPVKDRKSLIGYKYPILHLGLEEDQAKTEIHTIQEAIEKELFAVTFVDRMHLCGNCHGGFLNFKELDPKSGSANLVSENLIHHFSCAYIGPESDFVRKDQMVCPKCGKTLRHIGVDYDKPSVMYHSVDGDNYFQEPELKAECLNCEHLNEIDGLVQYDLFELKLTDKGIQEALTPRGSQSAKEIVYNGYITYGTFCTFLKYEIERVKNNNRKSSVGLIRLNITAAVESELGARYEKLIEEVSTFLANNTDSSNVLSRSIHSYFVLFPDASYDRSRKRLKRLADSIDGLIQNNVKKTKVEVISNIKELSGDAEYQNVLNDLRASILNA